MKTVNEKEFNELIKSRVVVQFSAAWCGPCKTLTKQIESAKDRLKDVTIVKVDIDEEVNLAKGLGIKSVPTMILFSFGKEIDRKVGGRSIDDIISFANQ